MPIIVIGVFAFAVPAAHAAPLITLSPSSGQPGDTFVVAGSGFGPNEILQIRWDGGGTGNVRTDGAGSFSAVRSVPAGAASGVHTVVARSVGQGTNTASATFAVLAPATTTTTTTTTTSTTTTTTTTTTSTTPPTTTSATTTTPPNSTSTTLPGTTTAPPGASTTTVPGPTTTVPGVTSVPTTFATPTTPLPTTDPPNSIPDANSDPGRTQQTTIPAAVGLPGSEQRTAGEAPGGAAPRGAAPPGSSRDGVTLTVDDDRPAPGSNIQVTATGLATDGRTYAIVVGPVTVRSGVEPDPGGTLVATVTIPDHLNGDVAVSILSERAAVAVASVWIEIAPESGGPPFAVVAAVAAVLLSTLLGAAALRRRRRPPAKTMAPEPAAMVAAEAEIAPADKSVPAAAARGPVVAPPVSPSPIPSSPWSNYPISESSPPIDAPESLATWDGGLWMIGTSPDAGNRRISIAGSLNGVTWSEPIDIGPGTKPILLPDRSQLTVLGYGDAGEIRVWLSRDGVSWTAIAGGTHDQPRGAVTAALATRGLVLVSSVAEDGSHLWIGRPDGGWAAVDIGLATHLIAEWRGRLLAFGTLPNGDQAIMQSEAGIRWQPVAIDAPRSFSTFRPKALFPLADLALIVGDEAAEGYADCWVSPDGSRWDPAPLGAPAPSTTIAGTRTDRSVVIAGNERGSAALWRTTDGIRWRRIEDTAMNEQTIKAIARYEARIHALTVDPQNRTSMFIREAWPSAVPERPDDGQPRLELVVDEQPAANQTA